MLDRIVEQANVRSLFELTWTVMAAIGLAVHQSGLRTARSDLRLLKLRGLNSVREVVARGNRRRHRARLVVKTGFAAIGINALLTPDTPPTLGSVIATLVFLAAGFALVYDSFADQAERERLLRMLHAGGWDGRDRRDPEGEDRRQLPSDG